MLEKIKAVRLARAYKTLFNSKEGQLVLSDLLKISGYFSAVTAPRDGFTTAFMDGRRALMTDILKRSNVSEKRVIKVLEKLEQGEDDE